MKDFLTAIGLVLLLEGVLLAASPSRLREMLQMLEQVAPSKLRAIGFAAMFTGLLLVGMIKTLF